MDRAQRHHAMVDFQQHQQRLWVVLEEDHEKVEKRAKQLEELLRIAYEHGRYRRLSDDELGRIGAALSNHSEEARDMVRAALSPENQRITPVEPLLAPEHPMAATPSEAGHEVPETDQSIAADCYWHIADVIGTEQNWSVQEHVEWMKELLQQASDYLHDIPESAVGGCDTAVELCRRLRLCLAGKAPGFLGDLPEDAQPARQVGEYGDAYQGAREDLAIWKRRALEAEATLRQKEQIIDSLVLEAQGETRMGEPLISVARQVGGDEREAFEAAMGESVYFSPEGFQHDSGVWVYIDYTTDVAWMAWRRRASLALPGDGWPKLDHPAKVGAARFMAGVSARLVVEAAQRQYAHDVTPENEVERVAKADALGEVARLNRNPIPVELLKRAADQLEYHMCSGCKEETCCMPDTRDVLNELRALLGKESEI